MALKDYKPEDLQEHFMSLFNQIVDARLGLKRRVYRRSYDRDRQMYKYFCVHS